MSNQKVDQKEKEVHEEERRREREKEEQEENEEEAKLKSSLETKEKKTTLPENEPVIATKELETDREISETKEEVKIEIPIVELDKHVIATKELEIDREISEIKEKVKITIPLIELEKPSIESRQIEFNSILPNIIPEEKGLKIPLIRLGRQREATCLITTFDEELPQVRVAKNPLKIPIYIAHQPVIRDTISSFDSKTDAQILQKLIIEEKQTTEVVSGSEPSGGWEEFEEEPDFVDFVFGVSNSKISSKGPKVVLYKELENDSTIGSFETLCIKIYREKGGGNPRIQAIKKFDEFNIREIEKWVEANKRIVTIDLDSDKKQVNSWFREENLRETLRRDIIGDVGFIIFKTRDETLYEGCKEVLENLEKEIEHPLNIVYAKPNPLSFEKKKELSSLVWGNLKLENLKLEIPQVSIKEEKVERPYGDTFDDLFNKLLKSSFEKQLEKLEKEDRGIYVYATEQDKEKESSEHLQMKWFIVKLLIRKHKLKGIIKIKEMIKTEEEFDEGVIPDICVDNSVYEVETLFAEDREGKIPKKKIENTITKYENTSIKEINVILDNLTFLRHLEDLIEIGKVLKEWEKEHGKKFNFYTIDIKNNKLMSLGKVIKKLRNL